MERESRNEIITGLCVASISIIMCFLVAYSCVGLEHETSKNPETPTHTVVVRHYGHMYDTLELKTSGLYIQEDETGERVLVANNLGVVAKNVRSFNIIK